ncbi:MAG: DUF3576 domain-containing protein [Paracoccaceae bacterium]
MIFRTVFKIACLLALIAGLAACGNRSGRAQTEATNVFADVPPGQIDSGDAAAGFNYERSSIWDVLGPGNTETSVQVNRYLWNASLEVLSFLPVQSVDPFTGVILTGYGTPPGGGRSYRATVHITDPALEARSLKVSLQTRGGAAVNASTARAVEDAILSRARQLRVRDKNL